MGVAAVVAGVGLAAGAAATVYSSSQASKAAKGQAAAAQSGIDATKAAQSDIKTLLSPYRLSGEQSLSSQMDLLGLNGNDAQSNAINTIKNGSQFTELAQQGENAILQNASATGGLRGGNTQAALAKYRPALLQSLIDDQYTKLGGLTSLGQNAAAQTGNSGVASANSVAQLLAAQSNAVAGGYLSQAKIVNSGINTGMNLLGNISNWGGLNSGSSSGTSNVLGNTYANDWMS